MNGGFIVMGTLGGTAYAASAGRCGMGWQFKRSHGVPAQRRLYLALAVWLQPGAVLPASRVLAQDLGIARNTAIHAYELLAVEGYVQATRQGTVVSAFIDDGHFARPPAADAPAVCGAPAGLSRCAGAALARRGQSMSKPWRRRSLIEKEVLSLLGQVNGISLSPTNISISN